MSLHAGSRKTATGELLWGREFRPCFLVVAVVFLGLRIHGTCFVWGGPLEISGVIEGATDDLLML